MGLVSAVAKQQSPDGIIYWCPMWCQGALIGVVLTVFAAVLVIKLLSISTKKAFYREHWSDLDQ